MHLKMINQEKSLTQRNIVSFFSRFPLGQSNHTGCCYFNPNQAKVTHSLVWFLQPNIRVGHIIWIEHDIVALGHFWAGFGPET